MIPLTNGVEGQLDELLMAATQPSSTVTHTLQTCAAMLLLLFIGSRICLPSATGVAIPITLLDQDCCAIQRN